MESTNLVPVEPHDGVDLINRNSVKKAEEHLKLFKIFVGDQLIEGVDYGKPYLGAPKPSLLKPGAEKLQMVFNFRVEFEKTESSIDHEEQFAMYSYKCTVKNRFGETKSQCEGSANTKEKKRESVPFYDSLNPTMKMAQKRAFVGAILLATNASDFFTQDIEDMPTDSLQGADRPCGLGPISMEKKCPDCGQVLRISKTPKTPNDYYYCWLKKGGCGQTFPQYFDKVVEKPKEEINNTPPTVKNLITKRELDSMLNAMKRNNWKKQQVADLSFKMFGVISAQDLNFQQWEQLMKTLSNKTPDDDNDPFANYDDVTQDFSVDLGTDARTYTGI